MVINVIVVSNEDIVDIFTGKEDEILGIAFCKKLFGGDWKQTSYNNNIRFRYAEIGYSYNADLDAFIRKKPYPSWILVNETADWESPIGPAPSFTEEQIKFRMIYIWNEELYQKDNKLGWEIET